MRDGITNHCLIAYSLSNIFAKNYQNWLMGVEVIVCSISVVFLRHSVYNTSMLKCLNDYLLLLPLHIYNVCYKQFMAVLMFQIYTHDTKHDFTTLRRINLTI